MRITHLCGDGNSARRRGGARPMCLLVRGAVEAIIMLTLSTAASAQTTLTWATPGANSDIANGANWVGGTPPNFAGDSSTDSAIFAASTNTTVQLRNVTTGDPFNSVTFDAAAPAYTFTSPSATLPTDYNGNGVVDAADYVRWRDNPGAFGNDAGYTAWRSTFGNVGGGAVNELVILPTGIITNNSANVQTMTGIKALTLNGAAGTPAALVATSGNAGSKLSFDLSQIKYNTPSATGNGGGANTSYLDLIAGYDVRTQTILGVNNEGVASSLYVHGDFNFGVPGDTANGKPQAGRLLITGDSGTNTGRVVLEAGGVVRITNPNALGDPSTDNNANATILLGGNRDGRVELVGNMTVAEAFTINGRQNNGLIDAIRSPAILNVSGTNTLTGVFRVGGGGNAYNFGSDSGTLVIQSDLNMTASEERYFTFQKAGNTVVNGNILSSAAASGSGVLGTATIVKYDSGTLTLNGTNNTSVGHFSIRGGTLAIGENAQFTHVAIAGDTNYQDILLNPINPSPPRVSIDPGATFDVTAKAGGYDMPISLEGHGTVKGTLNMASGTQVLPGAMPIYDLQGMSINNFADAVGKLTFDTASGMNLSAGAQYVWQLGAFSVANPGVDFDQVVLGGNLALGGTSSISIGFTDTATDPDSGDPFWNTAHSWKVIDTNSNTGNTNFASIVNGTFSGGKHFTTSVGTGGDAGDIFLNYLPSGSGTILSLSAVPEPSALLLLVLGALAVTPVRKR